MRDAAAARPALALEEVFSFDALAAQLAPVLEDELAALQPPARY